MTTNNSNKGKLGKRERTRLAIINAAITVIADKGLGSASIDELMLATNMARATFYNYFQTRDEVLQVVVDELRAHLHDNIEQHIPAEASAEEIIACMMYGIMQYSLDHTCIGWALVRLGGDNEWFTHYEEKSRKFPRSDDALLSLIKRDLPFMIIHTYIEGAVNTLLRRVLTGQMDQLSAEQMIALILRGLGVAEADIDPSINTAREFAQLIHKMHAV